MKTMISEYYRNGDISGIPFSDEKQYSSVKIKTVTCETCENFRTTFLELWCILKLQSLSFRQFYSFLLVTAPINFNICQSYFCNIQQIKIIRNGLKTETIIHKMLSKRLVFEWSCWESGLGGIVIKKIQLSEKKSQLIFINQVFYYFVSEMWFLL